MRWQFAAVNAVLGGRMAWRGQTAARVRLCGGALGVALLVTGCWGGGGGAADGAGEPSASATGAAPSGQPSAGPSPSGATLQDFVADPDRQPRTRAEALKLARKIVAKPADWGAGYVKSSDYKSGPRRSSELGEDCVWAQQPLPDDQFVSIVRRSELPAKDGAGPLRGTAMVTVHRTEKSARWDMAAILEEPLRCPDQRLSATERVTGLRSGGDLSPDTGSDVDYLQESGDVHSELTGGPHPYVWDVYRLGTVTLAVAVKASDGHDRQAALSTGGRTVGYMAGRAILELGVRK